MVILFFMDAAPHKSDTYLDTVTYTTSSGSRPWGGLRQEPAAPDAGRRPVRGRPPADAARRPAATPVRLDGPPAHEDRAAHRGAACPSRREACWTRTAYSRPRSTAAAAVRPSAGPRGARVSTTQSRPMVNSN